MRYLLVVRATSMQAFFLYCCIPTVVRVSPHLRPGGCSPTLIAFSIELLAPRHGDPSALPECPFAFRKTDLGRLVSSRLLPAEAPSQSIRFSSSHPHLWCV